MAIMQKHTRARRRRRAGPGSGTKNVLFGPSFYRLYVTFFGPKIICRILRRAYLSRNSSTTESCAHVLLGLRTKLLQLVVNKNETSSLSFFTRFYIEKFCNSLSPTLSKRETFLYWHGTEPRLCISDHELAKEILSNKFGFFVKPKTKPEILKLTGNGLVFVNGLDWVRHRRILNPAFSMDKIKIMTQLMVDCTLRMFEEWKKQRNGGESEQVVMMNTEFKRLTADIIATAAFGSSYAKGIEVFKSQRELQKCCAASVTDVYIPGSQYLPTPSNIQIWKLGRKVNNSIKRIIDARLKSKSKNVGNDLLGIMLKAARSNESEKKMSIDEIIDECKTFFFAGHETTANLLTWSTMLLSLHQDWQEKLREEVFSECGKDKTPDSETCSKLKLMNMVFMESLRLYGPVLNMFRSASQDMKIGNLEIPKGTTVMLPIVKMHRDKAVWGSDADKFNPLRFANGVSHAANHPNALLSFSIGPRVCIGQNFAIMEAKIVLAMMLQRFRLNLSGDYKHAPVDHLTLQPQYDVPVILQPMDG